MGFSFALFVCHSFSVSHSFVFLCLGGPFFVFFSFTFFGSLCLSISLYHGFSLSMFLILSPFLILSYTFYAFSFFDSHVFVVFHIFFIFSGCLFRRFSLFLFFLFSPLLGLFSFAFSISLYLYCSLFVSRLPPLPLHRSFNLSSPFSFFFSVLLSFFLLPFSLSSF